MVLIRYFWCRNHSFQPNASSDSARSQINIVALDIASRTSRKRCFCSLGIQFAPAWLRNAPSVVFGRHAWPSRDPRLRTQHASQNARPETEKQHGLASSRTPFFDLSLCHLQCQTLRPEPRKIKVFAALGYNLHLELASRCTFSCVWALCLAKPRLRPQKASQNARPETGKQHGLASSRTPFFDLSLCHLQCQNAASRT